MWGWTLAQDDFDTLSSIQPQIRYFDGQYDPAGPYRTYEDMWNESKP